jgi:hypothetical protein
MHALNLIYDFLPLNLSFFLFVMITGFMLCSYCVCFASGSHCSDLCGCEPCYNKPIHGVPRNAPGLPMQVFRPAEAGQDSGV